MVEGLRKEAPSIEDVGAVETIEVAGDPPSLTIQLSPLRQAVDAFFIAVVEGSGPLSAAAHRPSPTVEADPETWMFAVLARYHGLDDEDRALFHLEYDEVTDPVFSGRRLVRDVRVGFSPDHAVSA